MKYLAICEDDLLFQFMRKLATKRGEVLFLVQETEAARRIRRRGGSSQSGDLVADATYEKAHLDRVNQVILFIRSLQLREQVYMLLRTAKPELPIVSLSSEKEASGDHRDPLLRQLPLEDMFEEFCAPQLLDTINRRTVDKIRSLFREKDKIHILLQHDPDPDAIGSALALRELLGRNRATTPIVTFGEVTRPENLAMIRLLEIQIDRITFEDLHEDGAKLALVDVQPPYFQKPLGKVDLVVDHHPKRAPFAARFTDLRTQYGATSTIFTEYLRAALAHAHYEILEGNEGFYGEIPGFQGVYAHAESLEKCRDELSSVLEDWILLRVSRQLELPEVGGLRLTVKEVA